MSLTGWGVDAVEDAAAAALDMGTRTLGWGLQQALPQSVLTNVTQVLPSDWSSRLGFGQQQQQQQQKWQEGSVQPQLVQQTDDVFAGGRMTNGS
jgi:hypothetical protein